MFNTPTPVCVSYGGCDCWAWKHPLCFLWMQQHTTLLSSKVSWLLQACLFVSVSARETHVNQETPCFQYLVWVKLSWHVMARALGVFFRSQLVRKITRNYSGKFIAQNVMVVEGDLRVYSGWAGLNHEYIFLNQQKSKHWKGGYLIWDEI